MQTYTIREISRLFSLPLSTLRYYEEEGLLTNVQKSASGQRIYTQEHIDLLQANRHDTRAAQKAVRIRNG